MYVVSLMVTSLVGSSRALLVNCNLNGQILVGYHLRIVYYRPSPQSELVRNQPGTQIRFCARRTIEDTSSTGMAAVNVLTSEPLIFDSSKQQITSKHILATTGYPRYYFGWVEVAKGIYAWDGSLLSNIPLREVIDASPAKDKRVFLVENYPRFS